MNKEGALEPRSMPPGRLLLYLIGAEYYRAPFLHSAMPGIAEAARYYLMLTKKLDAIREEGLWQLGGSDDASLHQDGRHERLKQAFEKKRSEAVSMFLNLFSEIEAEAIGEVLPSHVKEAELKDQFFRTRAAQGRPRERDHEVYVTLYGFSDALLKQMDKALREIGRYTVTLEVLDEVSFAIDWKGAFAFNRKYYRSRLVDACREVWNKNRDEFDSLAAFAKYVWDTYQVAGYDPASAKDKKRFIHAASQNYRNWIKRSR